LSYHFDRPVVDVISEKLFEVEQYFKSKNKPPRTQEELNAEASMFVPLLPPTTLSLQYILPLSLSPVYITLVIVFYRLASVDAIAAKVKDGVRNEELTWKLILSILLFFILNSIFHFFLLLFIPHSSFLIPHSSFLIPIMRTSRRSF
jgi:hypothetical protein